MARSRPYRRSFKTTRKTLPLNRVKLLIIIGGNAAGMSAAMRARRLAPDCSIKVIERTDRISISNCLIPEYLSGTIENIDSLQQLKAEVVRKEHDIDVLLKHELIEIDHRSRRISIENLETNQNYDLPYDRLILATGADPIIPNLPNIHANGVFTLRNLTQAKHFRQFLELRKPVRFAVLGAGILAQVCASALSSYGMEVFLIDNRAESHIDKLEEPIAMCISDKLHNNDINVYYVDNIASINLSHEGIVTGITTNSRVFECQGILIATGIKPNLHVAKQAGIVTGIDNSIKVDRHLNTSAGGIYACGDCAQTFNSITQKTVYWPTATNASKQGRIAGENAVGGNVHDKGTLMTRIWSCFDLQIGRVGLSSHLAEKAGIKYEKVSVSTESKPQLFGGSGIELTVIFKSDGGRLIGAQLVGTDGVHARLNTLSTAISGKLTINDLEELDLGYTPKSSALWDPVQIAGRLGGRIGRK
ncbi:hypothetical protein CEE37_12510 [candidate division LCP-89 bacterium B3_LCP]|uniref:Pyridine nucleotide-disulfide oxidoreductase n=1 Tax=candidate division LCP-89 bacterium B3_LCP TaxID=2012998 RepID=A0A532UUG1_UNCL8|nr:MAG: hypothetical protein CEE37_12510 [candidate division LCP-89 bacterium B3_LCP]